jgi:hypothetical protein
MQTDPVIPTVAENDLVADIEAALESSAQVAALHAVAERLRAEPDRLRARLARVLGNAERTEALLGRSYRHHNGFTKIKLVATERFSVRLHLWPASSGTRGELNPHGHRWEFASWVAAGEGMTEAFFELSDPTVDDARGYDLYRYGRTSATRSLRPSEWVWLREHDRLERPTGSVYTCPRRVVHTVEPIGAGDVLTVVLQGPVVADDVPVYVRHRECPRAGERAMSIDELRRDLGTIDALLART